MQTIQEFIKEEPVQAALIAIDAVLAVVAMGVAGSILRQLLGAG